MEQIVAIIKCMTIGDTIKYGSYTIGALMVIVEFNTKMPWHPLSAFFGWIGSMMMKNINAKLDELDKQTKANNEAIAELEQKVDLKFKEKKKDDDEKEAKRLRANIISFGDCLKSNQKYSQTHFENIFRDIDDYDNYCETHEIPNHYIEGVVAYIKEEFEERLKTNNFI